MSWQCFNMLQIIWQAITVWLLFVSSACSPYYKLQLSANIFVLQCIWFSLESHDIDSDLMLILMFLLIITFDCWYWCWPLILIVVCWFFDNHAALLARATGTVAEKRITGTVVLGILLCLGIFGTFERDSPAIHSKLTLFNKHPPNSSLSSPNILATSFANYLETSTLLLLEYW